MTEARPARHRAERYASTPFTIACAAVTDRAPNLSRGSVAFAMSSGLALTGSTPVVAALADGDHSLRVVTEATIPDDVGSGREGSLASAQTSPLALEALTRQSMTATAVRVRVERDTAIRAAVHRQPVTPTTRPTRAQTPSKASRSSQGNTHTGGRSATPTTGNGGDPRPVPGQAAKGSDVLAIAARYVRVPYRYGGTTPAGFDCSGYVKYVYARLGISLPRKADQQMRATTQVQRSQTRPGDIVSFVSGGRVYHNGIYAGNGMMYDAPRTGQFVSKRAIWTATVVYTRVSTS